MKAGLMMDNLMMISLMMVLQMRKEKNNEEVRVQKVKKL
jgi:hypothetical protein